MLLFAPSHSAAFAGRVADQLGLPLAASEEREFNGGEHKMRPLVEVQDEDVFVIQSLNGDDHASANDKLCRLLFFVGALKDAGAGRVTAVVPYFAYARKDRRTQPRDPVTTRYVATMFEAAGVDRVVVLDIHNEAACDNAFRCPTIRLEAAEMFAIELKSVIGDRPVAVASPDIGGAKRAQRLRETLLRILAREVEFALVEKRRTGGVVSGDAFIGDVAGRDVVIYDDMIVSGSTIVRAAQAARRAGAKRIHVAAPHAAFLPSAAQLFAGNDLDTVMTSDSIALTPQFAAFCAGRLTVCSIAPLVAQTIEQLSRRGR